MGIAEEVSVQSEHLSIDAVSRALVIRWSDGQESRFPFVWMRHALHRGAFPGGVPTSEVKAYSPPDPRTLAVSDFRLLDSILHVTWEPDGAETQHDVAALRQQCPSVKSRTARKHHSILWDSARAAALPWFAWDDVRADATVRLSCLVSVLDHGLARITGLPAVSGAIEDLAGLFGPIHETGYGRLFDVRSNAQFELGANTSVALGPHSDESYRHAPPGISIFHCIEANPAGGGASILVDGFAAAARLRSSDPASYDFLTTHQLEFQNRTSIEDYRAWGRIIATDRDGDVCGIRYTDRNILPLDLDEAVMEEGYRALDAFAEILALSEMIYRHQLQPGEVHIFDNQRVLHGRTAFDPNAGARHLQQCAVDRDEFHCRLRMLAHDQGHPVADLTFATGALG